MTDEERKAENAESAVRDAAGKAWDEVRQLGDKATKVFRDSADKAGSAAKEDLKTAREFAEGVQGSIAEMDVREILTRQPWITVAVAFAVGFFAGQIVRRPSQ
jgi:ElaB/YqjD/DUF883 family membrane-anchored ribosome-binding protein